MAHDRETPPLFEFLAVLAVALLRKKVTAQQAGIAILVALTSRGTSGEHASVDVDRLALESGLSTRQVWRHFKSLTAEGWFAQTSRPTRGERGENGRRARYRLTPARLDLSHDLGAAAVRETLARMSRTEPRHAADVSHDPLAEAESCDVSTPNHVTLSTESCDIAEREVGTVTPSVGSTTDGYPSPSNFDDGTSVRATPVVDALDDFAEGPVEQDFDSAEHEFVESSHSNRFCRCGQFHIGHWCLVPDVPDDADDADGVRTTEALAADQQDPQQVLEARSRVRAQVRAARKAHA